jgi:hypothetical protein
MLPALRSAHRLLIAALTLVVVLATAGAAGAATPTWHTVLNATEGSSLNGVSCASVTMCLGVASDVAVEDGGPLYETNPDPGAVLNAVSCAPGTRFCMVVDDHGSAVAYENGAFGSVENIDGTTELESVSCPTAGFCVAIDHDDGVFVYSDQVWSFRLALTQPSGFTNVTQVSCSSPTFCVALASSGSGERYTTWDGTSWTAHGTFDAAGVYAESLTCTSSSFCLATDRAGNASTFNGTTWTTIAVDTHSSGQELFSGCAGTACQAIDQNDYVYSTTNGTTWTAGSPANIHAATGFSSPGSVSCVSATLCVAGDGLGQTTTYGLAITPPTTQPSLAGTPKVGQTLTLTHAVLPNPQAWFSERWWRCEQPDSACVPIPGATGTTYALTADDAGAYIDGREGVGVGLDEEGPFPSNAIGPVDGGSGGATTGGGGTTTATPGPGAGTTTTTTTPAGTTTGTTAPKLTGTVTTTFSGTVTFTLSCPAGATCSGKVAIVASRKTIGAGRYAVAAGKKTKVKVKLTKAGRKLLKHKHNKLAATLKLTPTGGRPTTHRLTLKAKR